MKPAIWVGIGLGALIVLAALVAPALRDRSAEAALRDAERARRELAQYSPPLALLGQLAPSASVAAADLDDAAKRLQLRFDEMQKTPPGPSYAQIVDQLEADAKAAGLPGLGLRPLMANEPSITSAISAYGSGVKDNETLLQAAIAHASTAAGAAANIEGGVLGIAQVQGMAEYVRAVDRLIAAERIRAAQRVEQSKLLALGVRWKEAQGRADEYRGLDVAPIVSGLKRDLDEIGKLRDEAAAREQALNDQVAARRDELSKVESEMSRARAELLALENAGFKPGDDAAFASYRDSYQAISERLKRLQEQEQILRYGGRSGADLDGDNLAIAEIRGGELVVGLEEMERRLEIAQERARRLNSANTSLEEHMKYVNDLGQRARADSQRYVAQMDGLGAEQEKIVAEITRLATEATRFEQEALKSAQSAAGAFQASQTAAEDFVRKASDLRSQSDPEGKNRRLELIVNDPYLAQVGSSAEAAARFLVARIQSEIVDANQALIREMDAFAQLNPSFKFDKTLFVQAVDTARDGAGKALDVARRLYEDRLSKAPAATSFVPLLATATVYELRAQLEPDQAEAHMQKARDSVAAAFKGREQNPYLRDYLNYREHLGVAAAPAKPAEGAPAGEK